MGSSAASGSSAPPAPAAQHGVLSGPALLASGASNAEKVTSAIENLIEQQKAMRLERKRIAQDLRNAQKKRARLKNKARLLSTEDLLTVVALREQDMHAKACAHTSSNADAQNVQRTTSVEGEPVAPLQSDTSIADDINRTSGAEEE